MSGSPTRMLSLLLVLCVCIHLSSSATLPPCYSKRGMMTHIEHLMKNHTQDCNCTTDVTNHQCRCLNITLSQGECVFPHYFIKGLATMLHNASGTDETHMRTLGSALEYIRTKKDCKEKAIDFCSLRHPPLSAKNNLISPKRFYELLNNMAQELNTLSSAL